ncbi:SDR family oxidoreductase [Streptomyces sp. NPDC058045]|uniref:SDR family oxidoreductase n=1 Tax=Streptomyces sp. NPDC058045 TaxID=3346311 RepID=UPI0036F0FA81
MTTILVTGGTGTLGTLVTDRLRARGHEVRVLSRHSGPYAVDLRQGGGAALDGALDGAGAVVHCASGRRGDPEAARHLLAAARRAGVEHLLYISIVGVDRVPFGYYRDKLAVERLVADSRVPWTVLRATQFHQLVLSMLRGLARPPVMLLPKGLRDQPVEVAEVADRLVELAERPAAGRVPDMAGPEVRELPSLARSYLAAGGLRRRLVEVPLAGGAYRAFRAGAHLAPEHAVGRRTFEEFLEERVPDRG